MKNDITHPDPVDNSAWPLCSWLVSTEHKAIFAPVAKNANTSLKRLFVRLSGHPRAGEILKDNIHIHLASNPTGLSLCDFTPQHCSMAGREFDYIGTVSRLNRRFSQDLELWHSASTI